MELKFGKYRGFEVRDVDDDYLQWLLSGQCDKATEGIITAAQKEIQARRAKPNKHAAPRRQACN